MNEKQALEMLEKVRKSGYYQAELINANEIVFDKSFLKYCEKNTCGKYNGNYTCPPNCGTPEEMIGKIMAHSKVIVFQTKEPIDEMKNRKRFKEIERKHNNTGLSLVDEFRANGIDCYFVGGSACSLCDVCAFRTEEECRHPEHKFSGMSSHCISVGELAKTCNMNMEWRDDEVSLFGMICFD